ncbi:MAG: thiamine diphosphokinase [Anaerolineales bacterium]|jgi:thiamine pyrophosphokinase
MARLIIFANGLLPSLASARHLIQPGDVFYAADGGTQHVLALGLIPSVVIGDLDSLTPEERQYLDVKGVDIRQYSRDKDQTDLELALDHAIQAGYREILVVGALGGRLDQTLGNLALLSDHRLSTCDIRLDDGVEEAFFTRGRCEIRGRPGDIVSLLPWGGDVTGICTEGLRWPLRSETLISARTRGISNEMSHERASIMLKSGLLLVIHHRHV